MIKLYSGKVLGKPIDIGEFIPLNIMKLSIEREVKKAGIPAVVELDRAKHAGADAPLFAPQMDCVVIHHAQYRKKYNQIVLIQSVQGRFAELWIYKAGVSDNEFVLAQENNSSIIIAMKHAAQKSYQKEKVYYESVCKVIRNAIGNADVHAGKESEIIGDVKYGFYRNDADMKFLNMPYPEECKCCNLLPYCFGGCPSDRICEKKKFDCDAFRKKFLSWIEKQYFTE